MGKISRKVNRPRKIVLMKEKRENMKTFLKKKYRKKKQSRIFYDFSLSENKLQVHTQTYQFFQDYEMIINCG